MSKLRIDYRDQYVEVYFTYDAGQVGSTDSYGAKYEPDYSESIDIYEIVYQGVDISLILSEEDMLEIENLVWEKIKQSQNEYDRE